MNVTQSIDMKKKTKTQAKVSGGGRAIESSYVLRLPNLKHSRGRSPKHGAEPKQLGSHHDVSIGKMAMVVGLPWMIHDCDVVLASVRTCDSRDS